MTDMLDAWTHIFPPAYFERLKTIASVSGPLKRWMNLPSLFDLDVRFSHMDQFEGYSQILTPSMPPVEDLGDAAGASELSRLMNDGLAELVACYSSRFPGWVGSLSFLDPPAAISEVDRAASNGALGFQIPTNIKGSALDNPAFEPIFAAIAEKNLGVWLHPVRGPVPDYVTEDKSRYEIWWCFGWPYESSVAMARLVFSGLFDRHPDLKIITHHTGAMVPFFGGRIEQGWGLEMGARTPPSDAHLLPGRLNQGASEYFRMFFADTALSGSSSALRCGLDYFGASKVLFATDYPFDSEGGTYLIRETIRSIRKLSLSSDVSDNIFSNNMHAMLPPRARNTKISK